MAVIAWIKNMNFQELFSVSKAFIRKPQYILTTYRATTQTIKICDELYAEKHHNNGKENAFRHALWNYLICKQCYSISGSLQVVRDWSDHITSLHEKLSPNRKLAKAMDLHNNRIGQHIFRIEENSTEGIIILLQQKMEQAVKISEEKSLVNIQNELVYIED
ncbi:hypothetical protein DET49_11239 [Salegentibacter sp. 24]|uniref:DUF6973 domain-containing protein n=1 Tax=Salegentibacter sp. 24 TaxID=2183986 RepID=UPI0010602521|nr:hypothetical protein [Salegentibacter sp. 24]TDN87349.1 hypothetical protein DET49_11239 [Salegentibacter sp. 24]